MTGKWFDSIEDIVSNMSALGGFQKKTSRNISNSGRNTGTSVCVFWRGVLRGINDKVGFQSFTKLVFDQASYE
jgi:hypothetical protein